MVLKAKVSEERLDLIGEVGFIAFIDTFQKALEICFIHIFEESIIIQTINHIIAISKPL